MNWEVIKATWKLRKNTIVLIVSLAMIGAAVYLATANDNAVKEVATGVVSLSGMETIVPVEGQDDNIIPLVQAEVDKTVPGVTVSVLHSANPQITGNGTIIYGSQDSTGTVTVLLSKRNFSWKKQLDTTIPAGQMIMIPGEDQLHPVTTIILTQDQADLGELQKAMAGAFIDPKIGDDINVIPLTQKIINSVSSGVTVDIVSSANSHVNIGGYIFYNAVPAEGKVTFQFSKGSEKVRQDVMVRVPARTIVPQFK